MNKPAILALAPLLTAVAFEATLLAAGFCSGRVGELAPIHSVTLSDRIAPADRQFLTVLEEQDRNEGQIVTADRTLLTELQVKDVVPRATFVAAPRPAPVVETESATSEIADSSTMAIPRATFVAKPRVAWHTATDFPIAATQSPQVVEVRRAEALSGAPKMIASRRSSIVVFNGKVFITRPTVMN